MLWGERRRGFASLCYSNQKHRDIVDVYVPEKFKKAINIANGSFPWGLEYPVADGKFSINATPAKNYVLKLSE